MSVPSIPELEAEVEQAARGWFKRRVLDPLLNLLRSGASPRRLAWSLAVGAAIGINPVLGSTTLVCLAVAAAFRLNLVASQLANHLLYPAELALFFVFIRAGERLFHTGPLPLSHAHILDAFQRHAWQTTRLLWQWEWHACVAWLCMAIIATPLVAFALTHVLERLLFSLQHQPIVEK